MTHLKGIFIGQYHSRDLNRVLLLWKPEVREHKFARLSMKRLWTTIFRLRTAQFQGVSRSWADLLLFLAWGGMAVRDSNWGQHCLAVFQPDVIGCRPYSVGQEQAEFVEQQLPQPIVEMLGAVEAFVALPLLLFLIYFSLPPPHKVMSWIFCSGCAVELG